MAVAATTLFAVLAGAALADQSYTDARGDAGVGTDITGATITNTSAGQITIQLGSANPLVGNHVMYLFVDADKNASTGAGVLPGVFGADYAMFAFPSVGLFLSWNGSDFLPSIPPSFTTSAPAGNVQQFSINRADMGNTSGFSFLVLSLSVDGEEVNVWDFMPDAGGPLVYDLVLSQCLNGQDDDGDGKVDAQDLGCSSTTDNDESDDPVTLKAGKASVKPAKPKAGTRVVVSVPVTRVETGSAIDGGAVVCTAKVVGGKAFRGTGKVAAGRAVCTFKVPLTAKKKLVRGTVAVSFETATARAPFSFRVA